MSSLAFVAQSLGKIRQAWWGLGLAAAVMIFLNPLWISDVGFLLSFASTAGILAFEKAIYEKIKIIPIISSDLSTTLSAQIFTAPIIFFYFGRLSWFSPLVNAAVLWVVPLIMSISGLAAAVFLVFEPLARILLLFSYPLAAYFVRVVTLF